MAYMTRATIGGFFGVRKVATREEQRLSNADWRVALAIAFCMVGIDGGMPEVDDGLDGEKR